MGTLAAVPRLLSFQLCDALMDQTFRYVDLSRLPELVRYLGRDPAKGLGAWQRHSASAMSSARSEGSLSNGKVLVMGLIFSIGAAGVHAGS
jgi:hypothetical protein